MGRLLGSATRLQDARARHKGEATATASALDHAGMEAMEAETEAMEAETKAMEAETGGEALIDSKVVVGSMTIECVLACNATLSGEDTVQIRKTPPSAKWSNSSSRKPCSCPSVKLASMSWSSSANYGCSLLKYGGRISSDVQDSRSSSVAHDCSAGLGDIETCERYGLAVAITMLRAFNLKNNDRRNLPVLALRLSFLR